MFSGILPRLLLVLLAAVWVGHIVLRRPAAQSKPQSLARAQTHLSATAANTNSPAMPPTVLANHPDFQDRPFPVAYESSKFQWTLADGKDTNVIRQLAHNHLEYDRMVEENSRIFRRQLVYLKDTAAAVFEQAKLTGEKVQQLTLPGVDGQELYFQIVTGDGSGSSRQGQFHGHLVGNADSTVALAFQDGCEAFTVLSPKQNFFLVGEPREPGQVIVKAIDPNRYGVGPAETGAEDGIPQPSGK
jgi:hypothetical protein